MNAQEIMTRRVITVRSDSSLQEAIAAMLDHGISGLPVVDENGVPVGMLSESDLLRRTELDTERKRPRWLAFLLGPGKLAAEYTHAHGRIVADVMSEKLYSVAPDTPVQEVVLQMEQHHIKRLPVMQDGRLVGIISRANLLRALALAASSLPPATQSDKDIRERLSQEPVRHHTRRPRTGSAVRCSAQHAGRAGGARPPGVVRADFRRGAGLARRA
jgi:CBS domain-containing protein